MTLVESHDECVREAAPAFKTRRKWAAKEAVEDAKAALCISDIMGQVDAYVHQMVLWSRDRLRPQLTGWYSRRHWGSIAKGHGPIPSQLFVKVSLP
ncbi:UNVERIFIED_CONTAM: hypothetical protein FKN15_037019 [Acipenser sinensis]